MRANELMVGDWVQTKEVHTPDYYQPSYKRRVAQINNFGVELFFLDRYGNKCYGSKKFDHIEPIPLTLEILQKNGFETDGEAIWASFCPEDKEFALEISEPNYYDENYGEREYWWTINACEYSIIPLRYVHELQHALKLCGIDKEIEL